VSAWATSGAVLREWLSSADLTRPVTLHLQRYTIMRSTAPRLAEPIHEEVPFGVYNLDTAHRRTVTSVCRGAQRGRALPSALPATSKPRYGATPNGACGLGVAGDSRVPRQQRRGAHAGQTAPPLSTLPGLARRHASLLQRHVRQQDAALRAALDQPPHGRAVQPAAAQGPRARLHRKVH
jgi:hypothetical protein